MEANVLFTFNWERHWETLFPEVRKQCGKPQFEPTDFVELFQAYPQKKLPKIKSLFENFINSCNLCTEEDVTLMSCLLENECLFSTEAAYAIDIIYRYLTLLNNGKELKASWCFLDEEQKAVIHFVYLNGWHAEAFFLSDDVFSALHIIDDKDKIVCVPVVFAHDISEQIAKAKDEGGFELQTYLPRELYSFLSKKGKRKVKAESFENTVSESSNADINFLDDDDLL